MYRAQDKLDSTDFFTEQPIRLQLTQINQADAGGQRSSSQDTDCFVSEDVAEKHSSELDIHLVSSKVGQAAELAFDRQFAKANLSYGGITRETLASQIADAVHGVFEEEKVALAQKLKVQNFNSSAAGYLSSVPNEILSAVSDRENRAFKYASTYYLTFSLFTPGGAPSSWAIEEAVERHIQPWLSVLSTLSNFSVDTQIQPYSAYSPSIKASPNPSGVGTVLSREDLSAFINAAEWPLSPSVGSHGPTLNFIIYVPAPAEIPLTIASSNGSTSWLVPQWGGVTLLNPNLQPDARSGRLQVPAELDITALQDSFETFTAQLLSLVGLPSNTQPNLPLSPDGSRFNVPLPLPLQLRLNSLIRLQTVHLHLLTRSTLSSLSRLYTSLPNIPVPATVADLVSTSLSSLHLTCRSLNDSEWISALAHARRGWEDSERAFFEKSMVGQVYFPDEHKVAVYLPLLGPVGVPLFVALLKEVVGAVKRWRETQQKKKKKE